MPTVTVSDHIAAPVEKVFAMFTDLDHVANQVAAIKSIEPLTTGPFHIGTRWRETRDVLGRRDSAEMEVTAFERNHSYTISHHKAGVHLDTTFSFVPAGDGTDVTLAFTMANQGVPPGLLVPLAWAIDNKVHEALAADLADLKRAAEHPASVAV